ncbi:TauD/TfdA family dioxygenase [Ramlibacter sp. PS3R-8]|uniref:TauD/TfdA dioxygenase family protein n=1 Tax=Ramlibacter sp. PS3R-8 TaxID=3133437 RepID=UPI0030B775AB
MELATKEARPQAGASNPTIRRVGVFLGAVVTDIDLSRPLDPPAIEALKQAHAEHGVLVFPDQVISSEDLKRFGRYFGQLSVHPFSTSTADAPELIVYDNKEGNPPAPTDIWHTDETFREAPPMGTALCSKIVPEVGGNTAFASMTAVYEGLSDRWQRFLSGLEAVHDFKPFRSLFPNDRAGIEKMRKFEDIYPSVTHPVVTVHPITGRKVIFVNPQFTLHIKGMAEDESRMILEMLYRKTLIHEYQYRHRWEANMLVFWDNRNVQHSALHDYYPQRRLMERVTIAGTRPIPADPPADESDLRRYLMPPLSKFRNAGTVQKRQLDL